MLPEDSHAERERNETEGEIQLLEFLKNIQNYEEQMNNDSYKDEGIEFTKLNILSFSWAVQLTEHLTKEHAKDVAPNDVDLTTLYLSKDLTTINLRKKKSREQSFLDNEKIVKEIKNFQEETKIFRQEFNVPYNQKEVQDMCGFIYVFYSIALVFGLYFTKPKNNPEEFINQLSLNHPPAHISPIIQRAITLYEEGELSDLKDIHKWLKKSRLECQFNLIELRKESGENILPHYPIGKFVEVPNFKKEIRKYSIVYEVSYINNVTSMLVDAKPTNPRFVLKEFKELQHNNGRNIRICNAFKHNFVSKVEGFIVDNHRIAGILFEKLTSNFAEITKQEGLLTLEILLQLALRLSTILTKMHEMGIVYRDLKPENIMVKTIDKDQAFSADDIRLIDFDSAKYLDEINTANAGTNFYIAPEMCNDERKLIKYNEKVDCYCLAMTLYSCMTKKLPYENWRSKKREFRYIDDSQIKHGIRDYYEYVMSVDEDNNPPELEYDADSYDDIKEIINMGKHADPKERSTMEEIKRAVEEKLKAQEKKTA